MKRIYIYVQKQIRRGLSSRENLPEVKRWPHCEGELGCIIIEADTLCLSRSDFPVRVSSLFRDKQILNHQDQRCVSHSNSICKLHGTDFTGSEGGSCQMLRQKKQCFFPNRFQETINLHQQSRLAAEFQTQTFYSALLVSVLICSTDFVICYKHKCFKLPLRSSFDVL